MIVFLIVKISSRFQFVLEIKKNSQNIETLILNFLPKKRLWFLISQLLKTFGSTFGVWLVVINF